MDTLIQVVVALLIGVFAGIATAWFLSWSDDARQERREERDAILKSAQRDLWTRDPHHDVIDWERKHIGMHDKRWEDWN